jgi:hypothetical protein
VYRPGVPSSIESVTGRCLIATLLRRSCVPVLLSTIWALITMPLGSATIDDHSASATHPESATAGGNGSGELGTTL